MANDHVALLDLLSRLFGWRELLDIALISLILFFGYRTFRRLGTWKIFTGILFAVAVYLMARILGLKGIEWFFANLSPVALVALIVIFQPEIRKFFERAASLRRRELSREERGLGEIICKSVEALSAARHGAILVIPGKESVRGWIHGGIETNAKPSSSLLMSIFDPHSPGHDGAVILEHGKIALFGTRLPLSKSLRYGDEFGTRHYAGLGLSEVTDALVVVVSEERGSITRFSQGKPVPVASMPALSTALAEHWEKTASYLMPIQNKGSRRHLIPAIIVSIVVAAVFWTSVIVDQYEMRERVLPVPLEFVATPPHIALQGETPGEIRLHLAAPKSELDRLLADDIAVKIDLSRADPGTLTIIINEELIQLPGRVQLLRADPPRLSLTLNKITKMEFGVKPLLVGTLPENLAIMSVTVQPERLWVLTAQAEASSGDEPLTTAPIYLNDITGETRLLRKIIAPPSLQPIEGEWPEVEVRIVVAPVEERDENGTGQPEMQ